MQIHHAGGGPCNEQLFTLVEGGSLHGNLGNAQFREVFDDLTDEHFLLGCHTAIVLIPLSERLSLVVTIPKTAVKDGGELLVPRIFLGLGERAFEHTPDGFLVALHHRVDIFGATCTTFYFENAHAGIHHFVDEAHGFQVFRTHNILVVHL